MAENGGSTVQTLEITGQAGPEMNVITGPPGMTEIGSERTRVLSSRSQGLRSSCLALHHPGQCTVHSLFMDKEPRSMRVYKCSLP